MAKLSSRPPKAKEVNVEDFIAGAERKIDAAREPPVGQGPLPWEDPRVRADVQKVYNLRLPEPYLLKLKYIAEHTPDSMQQFCLNVLLPAIDEKVDELTTGSG